VIEFTVHGTPFPQGSKGAFVDKRGKARMKESSGANFAHWRDAIVVAALRERERIDETLSGPLSVAVTFRYRMPASRPKSDRVHGLRWRDLGADLDKPQRAVGDALEASNLIASDSCIAEWYARKIEVFEAWEGAVITVSRLSIPLSLAPRLDLVTVGT